MDENVIRSSSGAGNDFNILSNLGLGPYRWPLIMVTSAKKPGFWNLETGFCRNYPVSEISVIIKITNAQTWRKIVESQEDKTSKEDRIKRLFQTMQKLSLLNEIEPITEEEIQAEIEAYREEKRARNQ